MTTLYRPVPITSAEQAEALPIGTYVIAMAAADPYCWCKTKYGTFIDHLAGDGELGAEEIAGPDIVALVPIEAKEETRDPGDLARRRGAIPLTRYVTPWEDA